MDKCGNLFANFPDKKLEDEKIEMLLEKKHLKLKRIISTGQITPENQWYDQPEDEWVLLLQGAATLLFENSITIPLKPGDYFFIPAHKRHRVLWTDPNQICLWLALYIEGEE